MDVNGSIYVQLKLSFADKGIIAYDYVEELESMREQLLEEAQETILCQALGLPNYCYTNRISLGLEIEGPTTGTTQKN